MADIDERPLKRFKHQSYKQTLKEVHPPSALKQSSFDHDIADNSSHFHEALEHWRELNLSPAFIQFAGTADNLSASMALLLHHWEEVVELWLTALDAADDEALKALLDLSQKFSHDLRTTLAPLQSKILERLLKLLSRHLTAAALTALLETFSALFKYIVIPSEGIETAWSSFENAIPKCEPEVQRAVAELWGASLRRLKTAARENCVVSIVRSASPDVAAWTFVSACKSVSQTLHTTTLTIFSPLLRYYLFCNDPEDTYTVLRRLLTALAHHCKSAEQYSVLADILVDEVVKSDYADTERLRRLLELVTIPCSVRQGSRLTAKHLSALLSQFPSLPLSDELHSTLLKFTVSCLTAGDMALWMGPGRKVFERVWERPILGLELCGALSDLGWGGWKFIALPSVLKISPTLLETHPDKTLEMLCALHREKRLEAVDNAWRKKLQAWVDERFADWESTEDKVIQFGQVIEISHLLISPCPLLVRVIEATLESTTPTQDFQEHGTNSAFVLGTCFKYLSHRKHTDWVENADIVAWTNRSVAKWGWCGYTMNGLVLLIRSGASRQHKLSVETLYTSLQPSLLSHSRLLRLSVLQLLSSPLVDTPGTAEVVKRCLQGEEVSIDVQGVRERILRIGRLGQVLKDGDEFGADIAARWLLAQLKVNLRPLWSPAAEALASLAGRFGDLVWKLVFNELHSISQDGASGPVPTWMADDSDIELDSIREDERTWRDPSAHKMRSAITLWLRGDAAHRAIVHAQVIPERFDHKNYESQLLATLGECPSLAEKHSRDLIPLFLSLTPVDVPNKMPKYKLTAWLELFSKFANPKALRSTDDLHSIYVNLLSHPDRPLQRFALSCIFTYKSPHLLPHEDRLRTLLDDTRWRDELTQLDISEIITIDRPEYVDVIIRLLFGLMLEKKGRSRGADRRAAVLTSLGGCSDEELYLLIDLMLKPINKEQKPHTEGEYVTHDIPSEVTDKQLVGFLTLLGDVVKNLGPRIMDRWPVLLETLLDVVGYAQGRIARQKEEKGNDPGDQELEDEDEEQEEIASPSRTLRTVRQLGLKRFADFFRCPVTYDFTSYMTEAYRSFISPRLESLDVENTQAPSALLELFHVWSGRMETVGYLVQYDARTLPKIYDCLIATNVKPPVVSKVFDIVENLLGLWSSEQHVLDTIFKPHVSLLLTNLSILVERTKGIAAITDPIGRRQVSILSEIAPYLTDSKQASTLLSLFSPLLRKPSKVLPEKIKVDLINIIRNLFPLIPELSDPTTSPHTKTYTLLAHLFQTLRSRPARTGLVATFRSFADIDRSLQPLARLLESLNAYSSKRMEEPDFDVRLQAFTSLNENMHSTLSSKEWLPILYNMLNFIQDPEELTIRNNASFAFKRFIDRVPGPDLEFENAFLKVLYPGLKNGLRSKNELVRSEILGVISYAVNKCDRIAALQEMRILLAGGDDEANFFNNIHHMQVHRRTRAIRRLVEHCDEGHLRSATLADVFVPLIGNFIMAAGTVDHHLANEAILATGRMSRHLSWGAYYALIQQYLRLTRNRDASERVYVRTIVAILDNFHFSMDAIVNSDDLSNEQESEEHEAEESGEAAMQGPSKLSLEQSHIADVVNNRLLPDLLKHLEQRDETEDSLRIPVAIGIVQVALHLPRATREPQISRLLTAISQILRSKSQETRDLTRETLCRIAVILGPPYLPMMLRELRGALLRGPHLHVLAFVTHSLLAHVTSGDHAKTFLILDDCVSDVAHVSAEVIFGESGKDVQSEEFRTKMREVRSSSSKGYDSFAILAKYITPPKISTLLVPIRNVLHQTETLQVMQQAEDVLRRIAGGLNANEHLTPKELLVLCHSLVSQNSRFLQHAPNPSKQKRKPKGDAIVELKRKHGPDLDHFANNSFRFVIFGLDLFNTAHRRSRFNFQDVEIIARLESMVPVIGNTLYSNHMQVVIPGLKAAAAIVKCPLRSIPKSLPVFICQMIDIVKRTGSTESEAVQTAFKSLATILRDQPSAQVKEKDLIFLLELLSPDLEEPARQASVFTMLRAIVARKFVVPEIYDLMERVAEIMVTNQSPQVQELCRGVLLQFLLEYPQGKGRLRNQMTFLAKNLSYVYESGRKSVMELLSAVLSKFEPALLREYSDLLFVALVMVIANDDSAKCREMASELIKNLFSRLEDSQRRVVISHVHSWASQRSQPQLARVSSQIYSIITDLLKKDIAPYTSLILEDLNATLETSSASLEDATVGDDGTDIDVEWQIPYHALVALTKTLQACPELIADMDTADWPSIISLLLFPHAWVRTASCRLIALLFASVPVSAPRSDLPEDSPFSAVGMEDVAKKLCIQLRSEYLDDTLSLQIVKNLFYVGKCFAAIPLPSVESRANEEGAVDHSPDEEEDNEEEEKADDDEKEKQKHPLPWLFSKLSYQARSAHIARRNKSASSDNWFYQPASVLRWFAAMTTFLEPDQVERFLTHILSPVYRIVEDDTIRDPHMDELKTIAVELQELVQTKVGTTKFANVYNRIRQNVLGVRRERKTARAIQATVNPAAAAKRKFQRNVAKKDSRKRKNAGFVEGKGGAKRRREY